MGWLKKEGRRGLPPGCVLFVCCQRPDLLDIVIVEKEIYRITAHIRRPFRPRDHPEN